jgi:hypothetical protein
MVGPTEGVGFGGPLGMEAWRGDLEGHAKWRGFGGPAGAEFLHLTSKFWSRGPYGGPHRRCSYKPITIHNFEGKKKNGTQFGWIVKNATRVLY